MEFKIISINPSPVSKDKILELKIKINNEIYSGLIIREDYNDINNWTSKR